MKLDVAEAGYRVPGIARWPGHVRPGTISAEPVCNLDVLPTVCALAGIAPPPTARSTAPTCSRSSPANPSRGPTRSIGNTT